MNRDSLIQKILWVSIFGIAMGYMEAAIVVYLRAIYYPEGFRFPLKAFTDYKIVVELFREIATIFMLLSVAYLSSRKFWERFAYFMFSFGLWDIFYYVWLKVTIDWPSSLFDWDILYLIPLPWISPVIAPVSISLLMIISSVLIALLFEKGYEFKPALTSYVLVSIGAMLVLYSFMYDTAATLHQQMPRPYRYGLLITGDILFIIAFIISYLKSIKRA